MKESQPFSPFLRYLLTRLKTGFSLSLKPSNFSLSVSAAINGTKLPCLSKRKNDFTANFIQGKSCLSGITEQMQSSIMPAHMSPE